MRLVHAGRIAVGLLILGLLLGMLGSVAAQPSGQGAATPTPPALFPTLPAPIPTAVPSSDATSPAGLADLVEEARAENLGWENITFWQGGSFGDSSLEGLALAVGVGDVLPDFEVPLLDGGRFHLTDEQGPLLLNFWASWCGPCRLELPYLLEMHADPEAPFDVALVNVLDDETSYRVLAEAEFPASLRTGRAPDALADSLGMRGIPVSILVDGEQRVRAVHVGNLTPAIVRLLYRLADDLAAEPDPSAPEMPQDGPSPELLDAVQHANSTSGGITVWAGGVLGASVPPPIGVTVGSKLPGFGLVSMDGENFVSDLSDEAMLYNFWASWCGPCVSEFPLLIDHDQARGTPYRVAFVNIWDDPVTASQFLANYPANLFVLPDARNVLPELYGLSLVPVSLVVADDGTVVMIQIGPVNAESLELADALINARS